ncbi:MFS general substrate transporter [Stemphylium lycopersici]|uniref:MFS general substrate transporter n=1 Tax=Stemphylium lycopersici TaxID=183478 RepID=A0A364N830_STELY|nr:MFS general substrate transporter [Stemphylium lycopersici]
MAVTQEPRCAPPAEETTPLLPRLEPKEGAGKRPGLSVLLRALLCAFLVSLTFGITQVPILYAFRIMTCDAYYEHHEPDPNATDICARREIEAGAARSFAVLASSTTIFGLVNLLVAGWTIKRLGVKLALIIQIFWPAVRLLVQNIGIMHGSSVGIMIVQSSQIITVVGGPNGYVLCLNSLVADVVGHEARTGALGRLQGCMYFGSAIGFLIGGVVGDYFGILAPFRMTLALFLLCCAYVAVSLPAMGPPKEDENAKPRQSTGIARFFGPLRIFAPQKWELPSGRTRLQFGALTLGIGVFLGILATGYIPVLLQMYATAEFNFGTKENGALIFLYSSLRGGFLSIVFPRIIATGRKWLGDVGNKKEEEGGESPVQVHVIPPTPAVTETVDPLENEGAPNLEPAKEQETFAFDLFYARFSLLLDGILTGIAVFVSEGWQMYLLAVLLPFAAGTGAASKGSVLQMLPESDRVDALSGITLVENIARLSTTAVFGLAFAALAEIGQSHLTATNAEYNLTYLSAFWFMPPTLTLVDSNKIATTYEQNCPSTTSATPTTSTSSSTSDWYIGSPSERSALEASYLSSILSYYETAIPATTPQSQVVKCVPFTLFQGPETYGIRLTHTESGLLTKNGDCSWTGVFTEVPITCDGEVKGTMFNTEISSGSPAVFPQTELRWGTEVGFAVATVVEKTPEATPQGTGAADATGSEGGAGNVVRPTGVVGMAGCVVAVGAAAWAL